MAQVDCIKDGTLDAGDNAWLLMSATLVFLQTPALAIMQAGMIRQSGIYSMFLQIFVGLAIGGVLWLIYGFALTYGTDHAGFIGDLEYVMLAAVDVNKCFAAAPTVPTTSYIFFQQTFAIMTPVIVSGTWAENVSMSALIFFVVLWPLFVWYPLAHWVWGGGWLAKLGVIDFAGGLIVHTSSGVAAFIVALMIGTPGVHNEPPRTEEKNVGLTLIGGSLIWAGWFGFNGGSFFNARGGASLAVLNTNLSASVGSLVWGFLATLFDEESNFHLLEFLNGALAGLAGITCSAGYVDPWASAIIGAVASICAFATQRFFKGKVFLSDTLDVCSLQGAPGISGSLMAGLFAAYVYKGSFFGKPIQIAYQLVAIAVTVAWSAFWTYAIMVLIRYTVGIFAHESRLFRPAE